MKLGADPLRSVCMGASRVEETENGVRFLRFTKQQEELCKVTNADFYNKTFATAELPLGLFSKEFPLGEGNKQVCVYFPWSMSVELQGRVAKCKKCSIESVGATISRPRAVNDRPHIRRM